MLMRKLLAICAAAIVAASLNAAIVVPPDSFAPGWKKSEGLREFPGSRLFDHIDGGAELFLEFGFKELCVQRYKKGEDELALEIYEMQSPEAALGLYLMKCGRETPVKGLDARNSGEPAQLTILQGRYFLHVNNFSGREDLLPVMTELARRALAGIPDEKAVDLIGRLPGQGLQPGSAYLFKGPVGLQAFYTLGEGDILDQRGMVFGIAGSYEDPKLGRFILILIDYSEAGRAQAAFKNLAGRLDPYLKILKNSEKGFVFEDFQKRFGTVALRETRLELRIGLASEPAFSFRP
jgi:hypothetical protein